MSLKKAFPLFEFPQLPLPDPSDATITTEMITFRNERISIRYKQAGEAIQAISQTNLDFVASYFSDTDFEVLFSVTLRSYTAWSSVNNSLLRCKARFYWCSIWNGSSPEIFSVEKGRTLEEILTLATDQKNYNMPTDQSQRNRDTALKVLSSRMCPK
ncbi:hypothetical protein MMC10_006206 [Thelotrema lepadinum]|nr:hypothetical protein [Thelotrema lepadinum]